MTTTCQRVEIENCISDPKKYIENAFQSFLQTLNKSTDCTSAASGWSLSESFEGLFNLSSGIESSFVGALPIFHNGSLDNSLVRIRCMVQDTHEPEYFVNLYEEVNEDTNHRVLKSCKYLDEPDLAAYPSNISLQPLSEVLPGDRNLYTCIPVPGLSFWSAAETENVLMETLKKAGLSPITRTSSASDSSSTTSNSTTSTAPALVSRIGSESQPKRHVSSSRNDLEQTDAAEKNSKCKKTEYLSGGIGAGIMEEDHVRETSFLLKVYGSENASSYRIGTVIDIVGYLSITSHDNMIDEDDQLAQEIAHDMQRRPIHNIHALWSRKVHPLTNPSPSSALYPATPEARAVAISQFQQTLPSSNYIPLSSHELAKSMLAESEQNKNLFHLWKSLSNHFSSLLHDNSHMNFVNARRFLSSFLHLVFGGDSLAVEIFIISLMSTNVEPRAFEMEEVPLGRLPVAFTDLQRSFQNINIVEPESGKSDKLLYKLACQNFSKTIFQVLEAFCPLLSKILVTTPELNTRPWAPVKDYESSRFPISKLQLPGSSVILCDETSLEQGHLSEVGVQNLKALATLLTKSTLPYDVGYAEPIQMPMNIRSIGLSVTRGMLTPRAITVPLRFQQAPVTASAVQTFVTLIDTDDVSSKFATAIRQYFFLTQNVSFKISNSHFIEEYLVDAMQQARELARQAAPDNANAALSTTSPILDPAEMHRLITFANLLAVSHGETDLSEARFKEATQLFNQLKIRMEETA